MLVSAMNPTGNVESITPSDVTDIRPPRALYVGGAGDVRVLTTSNQDVTFVGVQAGSVLPVRALRVFVTNTTATDILGLY